MKKRKKKKMKAVLDRLCLLVMLITFCLCIVFDKEILFVVTWSNTVHILVYLV